MMNLFEIATIACRKDEDKKLHDYYLVDEYVRELFKIENKTMRERILFKDLLEINHQRATSYANSYSDEVDEELDYIIAREGYNDVVDPDPDDMVITPDGPMTYADLLDRLENDTAFAKVWEKTHWDEFLLESGQAPYNKTKYTKRREAVLQKMPAAARNHFATAETIEKIMLDVRETLKDYGYAVKQSDLEKKVYNVAVRSWKYCALPGDAWAFCPLDEWLTSDRSGAVVDPVQGWLKDILDKRPIIAVQKRIARREAKEDNRIPPRIPYMTAVKIWERLHDKKFVDGSAMDFGLLFDPDFKKKMKSPHDATLITFSVDKKRRQNGDFARLCRYLTEISRLKGEYKKTDIPYISFSSVFTNDCSGNLGAWSKVKTKREVDIIMDNIIKDIKKGVI